MVQIDEQRLDVGSAWQSALLDSRPEQVGKQTLAEWFQVLGQDTVSETHGFSLAPHDWYARQTIQTGQDDLLAPLSYHSIQDTRQWLAETD